MEDIPVSEESQAFAVSQDVHTIESLNYAGLLPSCYAAEWLKVLNSIDTRISHALNTDFLDKKSFMDCIEREPILTFIEGVADVTDQYSSWLQGVVDLPQAFQHIIIVWQEKKNIECKHRVKLILILQSRDITFQQFHRDSLAFSPIFGYLDPFRGVVLSSALVAPLG